MKKKKLSSSFTKLIKLSCAFVIVGFSIFMLITSDFDFGVLLFAILLNLFLFFRIIPLKFIQYDETGLFISDVFVEEDYIQFDEIESISKLYFFRHHYRVRLKKKKLGLRNVQFISPLFETFGSFGQGKPGSLKDLEEKMINNNYT